VSEKEAQLTRILSSLTEFDRQVVADLLPLVYDELRQLAVQHMRNERRDHTLQVTGLVHETYLRIMRSESFKFNDRGHFYRVASTVMRHVLVEHAKKRNRLKRGGTLRRVDLDDAVDKVVDGSVDLPTLDEALEKLRQADSRLSSVVELRFFGGLTVAETAEALSISDRTVESDWKLAKLWLLRCLKKNENTLRRG